MDCIILVVAVLRIGTSGIGNIGPTIVVQVAGVRSQAQITVIVEPIAIDLRKTWMHAGVRIVTVTIAGADIVAVSISSSDCIGRIIVVTVKIRGGSIPINVGTGLAGLQLPAIRDEWIKRRDSTAIYVPHNGLGEDRTAARIARDPASKGGLWSTAIPTNHITIKWDSSTRVQPGQDQIMVTSHELDLKGACIPEDRRETFNLDLCIMLQMEGTLFPRSRPVDTKPDVCSGLDGKSQRSGAKQGVPLHREDVAKFRLMRSNRSRTLNGVAIEDGAETDQRLRYLVATGQVQRHTSRTAGATVRVAVGIADVGTPRRMRQCALDVVTAKHIRFSRCHTNEVGLASFQLLREHAPRLLIFSITRRARLQINNARCTRLQTAVARLPGGYRTLAYFKCRRVACLAVDTKRLSNPM